MIKFRTLDNTKLTMKGHVEKANNQTKTHTLRLELSRLAIFLSLIFAVFVTPFDCMFFVYEEYRGLLFATLACLYWVVVPKSSNRSISFSNIDLFWLFWIGYSFLSVSWAINTYAAIYGSFISLLIYIYFKIFQQQQLTDSFKRNFRTIIYTAFGLALVCEFLILHQKYFLSTDKIIPVLDIFKTNYNYISCVITLLFPFILFQKFDKFKSLQFITTILTLYTVYQSDSAMAFLVILGLVIFKLMQLFLNRRSSRVLFFLLSTALLTSGLFYFSQNKETRRKSYILKEMTTQNDRLSLYRNTLDVVSKTPFLGFGQSNWKYRFGENGYKDYVFYRNADLSFNQFHHSHNILIEKLSELGIFGSILLFAMIIVLCFQVISRSKEFSDFEWQIVYSLGAYFACTMIYGIPYNASLQFNMLPVFIGVILGLLLSGKSSVQNRSSLFAYILLLFMVTTMIFFATHCYSTTKLKEGKLLYYSKQYKQAQEALQSANILFDKSKVNYMLGAAYWQMKSKAEALDYLNNAVRQDPFHLDYLKQLANFNYGAEKYEDALETVDKADKLFTHFIADDLTKIKSIYKLKKMKEFRIQVVKYHTKLSRKYKIFSKYPDAPINVKKTKLIQLKIDQLEQYLISIGQESLLVF